jgi:hypothetical protein
MLRSGTFHPGSSLASHLTGYLVDEVVSSLKGFDGPQLNGSVWISHSPWDWKTIHRALIKIGSRYWASAISDCLVSQSLALGSKVHDAFQSWLRWFQITFPDRNQDMPTTPSQGINIIKSFHWPDVISRAKRSGFRKQDRAPKESGSSDNYGLE